MITESTIEARIADHRTNRGCSECKPISLTFMVISMTAAILFAANVIAASIGGSSLPQEWTAFALVVMIVCAVPGIRFSAWHQSTLESQQADQNSPHSGHRVDDDDSTAVIVASTTVL